MLRFSEDIGDLCLLFNGTRQFSLGWLAANIVQSMGYQGSKREFFIRLWEIRPGFFWDNLGNYVVEVAFPKHTEPTYMRVVVGDEGRNFLEPMLGLPSEVLEWYQSVDSMSVKL